MFFILTEFENKNSNLKSKGIGCINASPLSMGQLTPLGPPDWHRAPKNVRDAARAAYEYCKVKFID